MVDDHNSSMSTSFLSTCESMEIDEQTAGSPGTHDDSMFSRNNGKEPARTPTIPILSKRNQAYLNVKRELIMMKNVFTWICCG